MYVECDEFGDQKHCIHELVRLMIIYCKHVQERAKNKPFLESR